VKDDVFEIKDRAPLCFMHIPKTAGMSVRSFLRNQYRPSAVCPVASWDELIASGLSANDYLLVSGHFDYRIFNTLAASWQTLMLFRDPVERTISALLHSMRDPRFSMQFASAQSLTLREIVHDKNMMLDQDNIQSRYLSSGSRWTPTDAIGLCRKRLSTITFLGLTTALDDVRSLLCQAMNYHSPEHMPRLNQRPKTTEIADQVATLTTEDIAILRSYNEVDILLYDDVKDLISHRRFMQDMRRLVASKAYLVALTSFSLRLDEPIPGTGWVYPPEIHGSSVWRWSGPANIFTLDVPLRTDTDYEFQLSLASGIDEDCLKLRINLESVPHKLSENKKLVTCTIPRTNLARNEGFCRVEVTVSNVSRPSSQDQRLLGVPVSGLRFCVLGQE